ncbi:hypothetical protein Bhyg_10385 [Pseudolycoriella hygida]|uniref:ARMC5-like ARM-repeats domain-containing protein n=1 Tax=Pseudolycoriella hygida TaxID=35572 RepID=A0A9Q0MUW5_9DIPT|nr:hypothetical protein Bhyg_10385 [Pseudolycoriella hygida]
MRIDHRIDRAAMNKQIMTSLIKVISKSTDKNSIYKALVKLRTDIVKDKNGAALLLEVDGSIGSLVRLISKPYEKILEVSLSILGNACTLKECSKQAIHHGVVPTLLTILKSIPSSSVQSKACRLLGNLARESNEKICNLAKGIGIALAAVLEDNKDTNTLTMGIRAVRLLWSEMPFYDEFNRYEGVKKMMRILVKLTKIEPTVVVKSIVENDPKEKERVDFMVQHIQFMESVNSSAFDKEIMKKAKPAEDTFALPESGLEKELLHEIFRCLQTITQGHSMRVIYDFYVDAPGCSCIVFFAKADSPFRALCLKILSNLSKSQISIEFLRSADAITTACNLITSQSLDPPLSESEERQCISIICLLANDSCNRAKIRMSGAFKRIIEVAKDTQCDDTLSMILFGLQSFRYDNISIDLMIKMRLVNVLIERLDSNLKDLTETHDKKVKRTETAFVSHVVSNPQDDSDDELEKINSKTRIPKKMKLEYLPVTKDASVSPSNSGNFNYAFPCSPCSPCSSSSLSPQSTPSRLFGFPGDYDSEYSPVCSDIEDVNEDETGEPSSTRDCDKNGLSAIKLMEMIEDTMQSEQEEVEEKECTPYDIVEKNKIVHLIVSILCSVSYRMKHGSDLCTPEILNTLIQTCRLAFRRKYPTSRWDDQGVPLVLSHIVSDATNFVAIIKQDFIFKLYDMTLSVDDHEECNTCRDLNDVGKGLLNLLRELGESGYGRGEMAHLLFMGDRSIQKQVAVVTTYIIRDAKILHKLLVECGGIYIVIEIILTKHDCLANDAARGLTALSQVLGLTVPKANRKIAVQFDEKIEFDKKKAQSLITIIGGKSPEPTNRIKFDEDVLMQSSDVFSRMLNTDFKESHEKQINLPNQTIEGIKYFLHVITQSSNKQSLHVPKPELIIAVLETYDMTKIYMLNELEPIVFNVIVTMLSEKTVLQIFRFSLMNHKPELTELAINYYLSANISGELKVSMYKEADDSEYDKEWNQMILDTIVYTIQNMIY